MVEAGLFEDERVELIDGTLVTMSPQGALHAEVVARLAQLFSTPFASGRVSAFKAPSPPVMTTSPIQTLLWCLRATTRASIRSRPSIVEVSDSSLSKDRLSKARVYARAGVPEYWIVDLALRAIEVHTDPSAAGYGKVAKLGSTATVSPTPFPISSCDDHSLGNNTFRGNRKIVWHCLENAE